MDWGPVTGTSTKRPSWYQGAMTSTGQPRQPQQRRKRRQHERLCRLGSPLQTAQNSGCIATGTVCRANEPPRGFVKEPLL